MIPLSAEIQQELDTHLQAVARILLDHTEPEKLQTFEGIELEVRTQILDKVSPKIGEFFFSEGGRYTSGKQRTVKSCLGSVRIAQSQGKKLNLRSKTQVSPLVEKCCLRLCANHSYEQSESDINVLMGIQVGHSTLHRLVQKAEIPITLSQQSVDTVSVDGGKVRVRCEESGPGEWRDYKALSCHGSVVEAFFQQPEALQAWSEQQPLSPILTCLGDGHPGIWKIISQLGGPAVVIKREVLDWYHLKENLYKVGGSMRRIKVVEHLLWLGRVEEGIKQFEGLKSPQAIKFKNYLEKHQGRIPNYQEYQRMGITIGSGSVESKIKQIGARVKISGASWKRENVAKILRLRCAYLSNSQCLSIST